MITVHHLNSSRSQRILWMLEELGVEYGIKRYQWDPKTMVAPASLRTVNPLGKSPVITANGLTIVESGAMRQGKSRLIPPTRTPERLRYSYSRAAATTYSSLYRPALLRRSC